MYIKTIFSALAAWFAGLIADANLGTGDYAGFINFRFLFPLIAVALCILSEIKRINRNDE